MERKKIAEEVKWSRIIKILEETNKKMDFTATVFRENGQISIDFCLDESSFIIPKIPEKDIWKQ